MSIASLTLSAALAPASPVNGFDLALVDLQILGANQVNNWYEIEFGITIENAGIVTHDLDGVTPVNDSDNVGIQTYLWNNNGGPFYAASGWSIYDAPILVPGEMYSGTFTANTNQLADPLSIGDNVWLVVDLVVPGEDPTNSGNNRRMARFAGPIQAQIPAPGSAALAALGLIATTRRRR